MQNECNIFHVYSCIQFFFISIYNDQTTRIIIYCPVKKANRFILITTEPIFIYKKKIKMLNLNLLISYPPIVENGLEINKNIPIIESFNE
jgi:hypothetical protein